MTTFTCHIAHDVFVLWPNPNTWFSHESLEPLTTFLPLFQHGYAIFSPFLNTAIFQKFAWPNTLFTVLSKCLDHYKRHGHYIDGSAIINDLTIIYLSPVRRPYLHTTINASTTISGSTNYNVSTYITSRPL